MRQINGYKLFFNTFLINYCFFDIKNGLNCGLRMEMENMVLCGINKEFRFVWMDVMLEDMKVLDKFHYFFKKNFCNNGNQTSKLAT